MMSRSRKHYWMLFFGIALICFAQALQTIPLVHSAPLLAITPTSEPPTPVPSTPTTIPPTSVDNATATPNAYPPPETTNTPVPNPTQPPDRPDGADPRLSKSVDRSDVQIGDVIVFTLRVTNLGDETADNVVVTDSMPGFLDVLGASSTKGDVSTSGRDVTVNIGTVAPGEEVVISIQARVNESATVGEGSNRANLVASNRSDNPSNNTGMVTIRITPGNPTPTLDMGTPTETPMAGLPTETPVPTVAPPQPARMPQTNGENQGLIWFLTGMGLLLIGLSVWMRRSNI